MSRKKVKRLEQVTPKRVPKTSENSNAYLTRFPVWAFSRCDKEQWSLMRSGLKCSEVIAKLSAYENMTWQEIQSASGGKRAGNGTNSHFIDIAALGANAQKRARELRLDEITDQLFSLRLSGKVRLFGILMHGVFYIVWLDAKHEICPVSK